MKTILFLFSSMLLLNQASADQQAINDALGEYLDFATYGDGVMPPEVFALQKEQSLIIDVRSAKDFQKAHITNAIHIEWRDILNHLEKMPKDKLIIVYCDTGVLSSKVHLILKLNQFDNARVLFGGYLNWLTYLAQQESTH